MDKTVLITGGSRGLGRALGVEFAKKGAKVVLVARPSQDLQAAEAELRGLGAKAFVISVDISRKEAIFPLAAQAAELAGPVDILINAASTLGPVPLVPLLDTDCELLESTLITNLVGPFRLIKAVIGSMMVRKQGVVVNISSDAAVEAYPTWGAYSVSKSALDHLTRIWAAELKETSVRMYSVDPGEMNTQMHRDALPGADPKSLADPSQVARQVLHLIEESDRLNSGQRLVVSQGVWK